MDQPTDFDEAINRFDSHCVKWDMMETLYNIPADKGLAMWVADMDFRPPASVQTALEKMVAHGVYGYFGDDRDYLKSICWWMQKRHNWQVDPKAIFTTHGLVNAIGLCLHSFTKPDDHVVLMTPVYHAFARVIRAAGRHVTECELALQNGRYEMDFAAWEAQMTGRETMLILCSPHNPGGRVWSKAELQATADFAARHNLILVSDEVHHDLVFAGATHIPMPLAAPEIENRLVMLTAVSKTFNIAGGHTGNVIIHDAKLAAKFAGVLAAMGISPNAFGQNMVPAAYSETGEAWLDALLAYLDENRRLVDATINSIPGLTSMPLEATYLAWIDYSGTGMSKAELLSRIEGQAGIATNYGESFGKGGETFIRLNFATQRAQLTDALARLKTAFADLQ